MGAVVFFVSTPTKRAFSAADLHPHQTCFLHRCLTAEFCGLLFCFRSIPYIWCFGAVCSFSHHHGSGDLSFITIKSPNGSRVKRVHQKKKRISTYRTTFRRKGWGVFVLRHWCSRSSWGLHGRISRCRGGLVRHCAGFVAGESQSWYFRIGFGAGGAG